MSFEILVNGFIAAVCLLASSLLSILWYQARKHLERMDRLIDEVAEVRTDLRVLAERVGPPEWDGKTDRRKSHLEEVAATYRGR